MRLTIAVYSELPLKMTSSAPTSNCMTQNQSIFSRQNLIYLPVAVTITVVSQDRLVKLGHFG